MTFSVVTKLHKVLEIFIFIFFLLIRAYKLTGRYHWPSSTCNIYLIYKTRDIYNILYARALWLKSRYYWILLKHLGQHLYPMGFFELGPLGHKLRLWFSMNSWSRILFTDHRVHLYNISITWTNLMIVGIRH